jgi:hypothetical protein
MRYPLAESGKFRVIQPGQPQLRFPGGDFLLAQAGGCDALVGAAAGGLAAPGEESQG